MQRGFTLIELLVVIAIIGILSSVILASLGNARAKSRDATRLSNVRQIQNALELYYADNGEYPNRSLATTLAPGVETPVDCGNGFLGRQSWCDLASDLSPYIQMPWDPLWDDSNDFYRYYYDSFSADNYQSYGFQVRIELQENRDIAENDGGTNGTTYEVGDQVITCVTQGRTWWSNGQGTPAVCGSAI